MHLLVLLDLSVLQRVAQGSVPTRHVHTIRMVGRVRKSLP